MENHEMYNGEKKYLISKNNIVVKIKAVCIENFINNVGLIKPAEENTMPFAYINGKITLWGVWQQVLKYEIACQDKDLQQEYLFTFWKVGDSDEKPTLNSTNWMMLFENDINLIQEFSSLMGKNQNYVSDFNRYGVPENVALILNLSKELLNKKVSQKKF